MYVYMYVCTRLKTQVVVDRLTQMESVGARLPTSQVSWSQSGSVVPRRVESLTTMLTSRNYSSPIGTSEAQLGYFQVLKYSQLVGRRAIFVLISIRGTSGSARCRRRDVSLVFQRVIRLLAVLVSTERTKSSRAEH